VENVIRWIKARKSDNGGECVEVGITAVGRAAGIRDSKSPERGHLGVTPEVFAAFLADAKSGRYDLAQAAWGPAARMGNLPTGKRRRACCATPGRRMSWPELS
jgi:hypothetical protein